MPRHKTNYQDEGRAAKGEYDDPYDYSEEEDADYKTSYHKKSGAKTEKKEEVDFRVDAAHHGLIIGAKGATIRMLRETYDCEIDMPERGSRGAGANTIYLYGLPSQIDLLKKRIKELIDENDATRARRDRRDGTLKETSSNVSAFPALAGQETVVVHVDFEKFAHGKFIGAKGARLHDLRKRLSHKDGLPIAGGQILGVEVIIPDQADTSSIISVKVPKAYASNAQKTIREFCEFYELLDHLRDITVMSDVTESMKTGAKGSDAQRQRQQPAKHRDPQPAAATAATTKTKAASPPMSRQTTTDSVGGGKDVKGEGQGGSEGPSQRVPRKPLGTKQNLVPAGYTHEQLPKRDFRELIPAEDKPEAAAADATE